MPHHLCHALSRLQLPLCELLLISRGVLLLDKRNPVIQCMLIRKPDDDRYNDCMLNKALGYENPRMTLGYENSRIRKLDSKNENPLTIGTTTVCTVTQNMPLSSDYQMDAKQTQLGLSKAKQPAIALADLLSPWNRRNRVWRKESNRSKTLDSSRATIPNLIHCLAVQFCTHAKLSSRG